MRIFILLISCFFFTSIQAQGNKLPLEGKTVAVYFSKKAFQYDKAHNHLLSQFVKMAKGDSTLITDVKLQSLVSLGELFSSQLAKASQADSAFFLNANFALGQHFIKSYTAESQQLEPLGPAFAGVDYVLSIDEMVLKSNRVPAVYSRSNRIITTYDMVKTGRIRLKVYDAKSGRQILTNEACLKQRDGQKVENLFDFHSDESQTGKFLAKLFSLTVQQVNQGEQNSCTSQ